MQVKDAMTRDVHMVNPNQSIVEAAKMMADCDCGSLPVSENDRLAGMITDRDIVVRCLAQGMDGKTRVKDVMSSEVKYCFEDEEIDHVAQNMGDLQIRRLAVVDRNKRLTGILSLGDIATQETKECASDALCRISEESSAHASGARHGPH